MKKDSKKKSSVLPKIGITLLSFIPMFSGLGMIIAGRQVKKKKWITVGVIYILVQWICMISVIGSIFVTFVYILSIIHTFLRSAEYGSLLYLKQNKELLKNTKTNESDAEENVNYYKKNPQTDSNIEDQDKESIMKSEEEIFNEYQQEEENVKKIEEIKIEKIPLDIGLASVIGKDKSNLTIHIQNSSGKLYEFNTQGNILQSFEINGKIYNYGE